MALQDLKEYLGADEEFRGVIAYDFMRPPPVCVTPNQRLLEVLPVVLASEQRNIPVVSTLQGEPLGGGAAARGGAGDVLGSHRREQQSGGVVAANCQGSVRSEEASEDGEGLRQEPDDQHRLPAGETAANQAVGEMVGIALIKRLADAPAEENDPNQIGQRDGKD